MGMTIIKNYGMPHNCYDCDLHNYHECDLTSESIEEDYCWNGDSREKHCPLREVEAIPKDQYEARLKADMVTMLEDLKKEMNPIKECEYQIYGKEEWNFVGKCQDVIQQKINALRGNEECGNIDG